MKKSSEVFNKAFDKVASQMKMSPETFQDINVYKTSLKELDGGLADNMSLGDIAVKHKVDVEELTKEFLKGIKVEMEHTDDKSKASEIAMDHLAEDPKYYSKLKKIEGKEATGSGSSGAFSGPLFGNNDDFITKSDSETPKKIEATEATGSGSVGAYETPAAWAKSTKKKDWAGKSKPLYKGGSFVSVKKKCTKFPYCNAGDINALDIYENENLKEAIKNVASKMNLTENTIKAILQYEYEKVIK
jgi:hypothetical protein